jgi:alpha 1,6-mannosyltransferase
MGSLKYVLLTALLVFSVLNLLSANIFNPSIHDAKIEQAFKTAAELRSAHNSGKEAKLNSESQPLIIRDHNGNILTRSRSKDVHSLTTILDRLLYNFPYNPEDEVEINIFQIWTSSEIDNPELFPSSCLELVKRWGSANKDHHHIIMSIAEAEDIIADIMRPLVPEVVDALRELPNNRLKFEFLKYLIIYLHGGVYADIDTNNVKPIKHWFKLETIPTKFWLGIDSDSNNANWMDNFSRRLTFNNNIFRSKAYHPLLARLIARITFIIHTQKAIIDSINWDKEFSNYDASGAPLIQFTGTAILTDTAFEYLNNLDDYIFFTSLKNENYKQQHIKLSKHIFGPEVDSAQKFSYKSFTLLSSPVQVHDVAILPKISFTGYDSAQIDFFDDNNEKKGYEKYYYGRSKDLTPWSPKRLRLDSN